MMTDEAGKMDAFILYWEERIMPPGSFCAFIVHSVHSANFPSEHERPRGNLAKEGLQHQDLGINPEP